jgi:esterase FrsA
VREALNSVHTRDKDEWAAAFMGVADRYMNEAKSLEKTDPTKANADYIRAWRLYSFGRWPIPASPGKQRSYEKALEAFLAHARFLGSADGDRENSLSKGKKSSATCACRRMRPAPCRWCLR